MFFLTFNITAFANPGYLDYGTHVSPLVHIANCKYYNIYATTKTLDFLDRFSTYRDTKIWQLDIVLEFVNEEYRQKIVKIVSNNKAISFVNAPSGSRRLDAIRWTLAFNPGESLLRIGRHEDVFNEHGELIGMKTNDGWEDNKIDLNNQSSTFANIVKQVNIYLEQHYPPRRISSANVE